MATTSPTTVETSTTSARATEPIEVVEAFLAALEDLDIDAAVALLDPAIVYQNMPLPPAQGIAAVEKQLRGLGRFASGFQARTHNIAANGAWCSPSAPTSSRSVAGGRRSGCAAPSRCRDGRIVEWRDYFDYADVTVAMAKAAYRARAAAAESIQQLADGGEDAEQDGVGGEERHQLHAEAPCGTHRARSERPRPRDRASARRQPSRRAGACS